MVANAGIVGKDSCLVEISQPNTPCGALGKRIQYSQPFVARQRYRSITHSGHVEATRLMAFQAAS